MSEIAKGMEADIKKETALAVKLKKNPTSRQSTGMAALPPPKPPRKPKESGAKVTDADTKTSAETQAPGSRDANQVSAELLAVVNAVTALPRPSTPNTSTPPAIQFRRRGVSGIQNQPVRITKGGDSPSA